MFFAFCVIVFRIFTIIWFNYERLVYNNLPTNQQYDYIIVGSGSAGSYIATELKGRILLIEAGSPGDNFLFNIPIVQPAILRSEYDWKYAIEPQLNSCRAFYDNRCNWSAGKILGGSHRLNNMIYQRGALNDYEEFISADEALKFYEIYESKTQISQGYFQSEVSAGFVNAGKTLGFNNFGLTNLTTDDGHRFTHAKRISKSDGPEIVFNGLVTRILFSKNNSKEAIGVEFEKSGQIHKVFGKKIVLSAGAIGSPKILLLSGIGPADDLRRIGIKARENLPVGLNLQDHISTGLDLIQLKSETGVSISDLYNPFKMIEYFLFKKKQNLFTFAGCDAIGFINLKKVNSNSIPDLSFFLIPTDINSDNGVHLKNVFNIRPDLWNSHFKSNNSKLNAISIMPILLKPKSKGFVKLRSKHFRDPPIINPNYLAEPEDVHRLVEGIRFVQKLLSTPDFKNYEIGINSKKIPGCETFYTDSFEYWDCYIKLVTLTVFHPTSTCKLGKFSDNSTVVLPNFQVKNMENLFVVDGSVLPSSPSANPHATIAMMAQKFICEQNNYC